MEAVLFPNKVWNGHTQDSNTDPFMLPRFTPAEDDTSGQSAARQSGVSFLHLALTGTSDIVRKYARCLLEHDMSAEQQTASEMNETTLINVALKVECPELLPDGSGLPCVCIVLLLLLLLLFGITTVTVCLSVCLSGWLGGQFHENSVDSWKYLLQTTRDIKQERPGVRGTAVTAFLRAVLNRNFPTGTGLRQRFVSSNRHFALFEKLFFICFLLPVLVVEFARLPSLNVLNCPLQVLGAKNRVGFCRCNGRGEDCVAGRRIKTAG